MYLRVHCCALIIMVLSVKCVRSSLVVSSVTCLCFFSPSGYIAMFIHPFTWSFYTASVLVGIGAAGAFIQLVVIADMVMVLCVVALMSDHHAGAELSWHSNFHISVTA